MCTPKLQLLHNTEQRSLDMERWLITLENFYIWKTFTREGNYLVLTFKMNLVLAYKLKVENWTKSKDNTDFYDTIW